MSPDWVANNLYDNLSASTTGNGVGALFNVEIDGSGDVTITLISPGSGYSDNDPLTITSDQLGGAAGGQDLTFRVNQVNASGELYYLPITKPST